MRPHALVLVFSLLLLMPALADAKGPEDGYGGFKWASAPARDMTMLESSAETGYSNYKREADQKTFCGFTIALPRYLFYENRLASVSISGFDEDFDKALACLTKRWGAPTGTRKDAFDWYSPATHAWLERRPAEKGGGFHVMLLSKEVFAQTQAPDKDKEKAQPDEARLLRS